MIRTTFRHVAFLGCLLLAANAYAQTTSPAAPGNAPGDDDPSVLQGKMRNMFTTLMGNMQQQGVDPAEFWQDVRKRMADGSLDMEGLTQELLDKNLIDQKTVDDIRGTAERVTYSQLKKQLGVTDEEWAVLLPKIKDVLTAMAGTGTSQFRGGNPLANLAAGAQVSHDVRIASAELRRVLRDKDATNDQLQEKMKAVRDAKAVAEENLGTAQKALVELLTPKQEAIMASIGLVP